MLPNPDSIDKIAPSQLDFFDGLIVDVRIPEAYAETHLEGAINFPVYQVDFLDKFPEAYPDRDSRILVYGDGAPYKADLAAVGRLSFLGYHNVSILEGGLSRWLEESRPTKGSGWSGSPLLTGNFTLDTERTKIRWIGRNLLNQHHGEVPGSKGSLEMGSDGTPLSGKVSVDLTRMVCHDLTDSSLASGLIGHLSNADFFDVGNHPEASFELKSANRIEGATYGRPNFSVTGVLSARGQSAETKIEALLEPIENGYVFQSTFEFDRTQFGAIYGSGRFFERLGMHLVNDLVSMDITAFFNAHNFSAIE